MGRRNLLTEEERDQFFLVSVNEANLIKHYTLSPDDLEKALAKRGARNQLALCPATLFAALSRLRRALMSRFPRICWTISPTN